MAKHSLYPEVQAVEKNAPPAIRFKGSNDVVYFLIAKKGRIIYNICILPYCRLP